MTFLTLCKTEHENILALTENENSETSLIGSMISVTQVKNEEKSHEDNFSVPLSSNDFTCLHICLLFCLLESV